MKKLFLTTLVFWGSTFTFAIGGIWVLEVKYQLSNCSRTTYVLADYWADDFDKFKGKDAQFEAALEKQFGDQPITVFDNLVDQENIANAATFPMHPFIRGHSSERVLHLNHIQGISLVKVWEKVDYMIEVQTGITEADIPWISKKAALTHPVGEDVGCRLEVHSYCEQDNSGLLEQFVWLYENKEEAPERYANESPCLLQRLKYRGVVIVELCGC